MCLLVFVKAGSSLPEAHIREAFKRNRDGAGFAFHTPGDGLRVTKGYFEVEELVTDLKAQDGKACVVHFRWATHGSKTEQNCHPFICGGGWVVGHNGVFSGMKIRGQESDTAAFVRDYLQPVLKPHPKAILEDGKWRKALEHASKGSKLAFLNTKGESVIIHEDQGHWEEGVWYSNSSYKVYVPPPRAAWTTPNYTSANYRPDHLEPWYTDKNAYLWGWHDDSNKWHRNPETLEEYMAKKGWKKKEGKYYEWERIILPAMTIRPSGRSGFEHEGIHSVCCMKPHDNCDMCEQPFGGQNQYWVEDGANFICQKCFAIITEPEPEEVEYRILKEGDPIPKGAEWENGMGGWTLTWLVGQTVGEGKNYRRYRVPVLKTPAVIDMVPMIGPNGTVYEADKAHAEDEGPVCLNGEDDTEEETPDTKILLFPATPEV